MQIWRVGAIVRWMWWLLPLLLFMFIWFKFGFTEMVSTVTLVCILYIIILYTDYYVVPSGTLAETWPFQISDTIEKQGRAFQTFLRSRSRSWKRAWVFLPLHVSRRAKLEFVLWFDLTFSSWLTLWFITDLEFSSDNHLIKSSFIACTDQNIVFCDLSNQ